MLAVLAVAGAAIVTVRESFTSQPAKAETALPDYSAILGCI